MSLIFYFFFYYCVLYTHIRMHTAAFVTQLGGGLLPLCSPLNVGGPRTWFLLSGWRGKRFYLLFHLAKPFMTRSFSSCRMDYLRSWGAWLGLSCSPVFSSVCWREPILTSEQTGRCLCNPCCLSKRSKHFFWTWSSSLLSIAVHQEHPLSVVHMFHSFLNHLLKKMLLISGLQLCWSVGCECIL